jgi:branched-chain amino acid transport system ATP-binding protein
VLEVNKIHVAYGSFTVLRGITLNAAERKIIAILGPNGHGKTTLLKTISGLLTPYEGYIKLNGKLTSGLSPQEIVGLGIVYVQGEQLFSQMTVKENLYLGAYSAWDKRKELIKNVYQQFPVLEERKNQIVWTLSGGERRMVAVGRGLMSQAKVLMLDEPFTGLAPIVIDSLIHKITDIKNTGVCIILVEQQVEAALEVADYVYILESGLVQAEGEKEEIMKSESIKSIYLGG